MKTFRDTAQRTWTIDLNIGAIRRVKDLANVDLLSASDGRVLAEIADDPYVMANVLYAIIQPQASTASVTDENFGEAMDGETMRAAIDAFVEELIAFFLRFRPEVGRVLQVVWKKIVTLAGDLEKVATAKVDSPQMDEAARRLLDRVSREIDERLAAT